MDPGNTSHIVGLVASTSERTSTSSSSARGAEQCRATVTTGRLGGQWYALAGCRQRSHQVVNLGRWLCVPKALASSLQEAWEAPPTGWGRLLQDLSRNLDMILHLRGRRPSCILAPRHRRWTAPQRHSKRPPWVETVPGPLPTASAAGFGPDQDGGPHRVVPTSPEGREATAQHWTDVGHGRGLLWGRGRGRRHRSPVRCQMVFDLHHSTGRAPAGLGLAGLRKPGWGHTAQDCASQGLGIAEAADRLWLYQLEAWHPGVDCRWHRTQGHQSGGPGRTCCATTLHRAAGAWLTWPTTWLCRVGGRTQAC